MRNAHERKSDSEELRRSTADMIERSREVRERASSVLQRVELLTASVAAAAGERVPPRSGAAVRVLVVEDDPDVRSALKTLLARHHLDVQTAASVEEALEALTSWKPSCVLLDLVLPGASGVSLLEEVRSRGLPVRVAVVTATRDASLLEQTERLAPERLFRKPVDVATLVGWITDAPAESP